MNATTNRRPICHKCGEPHDDVRRAYCKACAEIKLIEFGARQGQGVSISLVGDPARPVRKVAMVTG